MKWLQRLFGKVVPARIEPEAAPPVAATEASCTGDARHSCMEGELSLRPESPQLDLFVARAELAPGGDLVHGAHHLANLLEVDPGRRDWRELADRYIAAQGDDPLALAPHGDTRYASIEALRAYILHTQGSSCAAVSLLIEVSVALGDCRYLDAWALDWLAPPGALEALPEATGASLFGTVLALTAEAKFASAASLARARHWARMVERVAPRYARTPLLIMVHAGLQRKAGDFDRALAIAGPLADTDSFNQAVAIGLVHRQQGHYHAAEQAFMKALDFEPDNISGRLEAGDACFDARDWRRALAWYEAALAQQEKHPWALASAVYCRDKLDPGASFAQQIVELAREGNERARRLWFADHDAIAQSADASANLLRQMSERWRHKPPSHPTAPVAISTSTLEAPSNRLAFGLAMAAAGMESVAVFSAGPLPLRDPRVAIAEVRYPVWRYVDMTPVPALDPPPAAVSRSIAMLAALPYDPWLNWDQASHVAHALGTAHVGDILAVMVYPPPLPEGGQAVEWLARIQLAAAQVAGQLDQGWDGSVRREALLSLLYGPWDWTTSAAIRVLARIACNERALAGDIHRAFDYREQFLPTEGHWDWTWVLYEQWLALPYLSDSERARLQRRLEEEEAHAEAEV